MKRIITATLTALTLAAAAGPAGAADAIVKLTIDGRPVDRATGVAVQRNGVVYADVVDLVKAFDGLLTFSNGHVVKVSIGNGSGTFTPGSRQAVINGASAVLPGAPFMRNGDLFVPLVPFIKNVAAAGVVVAADRSRADVKVALPGATVAPATAAAAVPAVTPSP